MVSGTFFLVSQCTNVNIRVMSVYAGPSGSTCQDIGVRGALELTFIDIDIYPTHLQLVQVILWLPHMSPTPHLSPGHTGVTHCREVVFEFRLHSAHPNGRERDGVTQTPTFRQTLLPPRIWL